ncbi:arf-GAP with Rho-GAP domain, ANK repeat and PH domain-containing protein 1-like isoform X2 [Liolophura sinensis]|uniref:arf-GAP with Rho-GAP domain, ANK repeat and PH domain-containing protein 1-like isoform X2 n=1 Tax=Liolophura sinensis TaxID=3198878 RepID=UPI0031590E40
MQTRMCRVEMLATAVVHQIKLVRNEYPFCGPPLFKEPKKRSGYLQKQGGVQNNRGWRRRWVIFNGEDLRYYTDNKTCVSKKILPVSCMANVVNDIKMEDNRKYRFKVVTANRVYIFAADTLEENHLWSSTIMEAILKYKPPPDGIKDGGRMHSPDKEGFVKIDGIKNKCFMAIKKDVLCYYNNYEDFIPDCAINEIQMKLASVKELGQTKLQLSTHYSQFVFTFDNAQETQDWKIAIEDAIAEGLADDTVLKKVMVNSSNQWCADCRAPKPHWAAINLGIVLCKKCAGIHRELGSGISRVKSLRMDTKIWTPSLIGLIVAIGNENANNFWEFDMLSDMEIESDTTAQQRKHHIEEKYKHRKFCRLHPKNANKTALNQELLRVAETDDVLKTMQILFSGAEILYHRPGNDGETAFEIAKAAGQSLQMELLYQNGGDKIARLTDSPTFMEAKLRSTVRQQGFMYKTGSNRKDFLRRWCQLERGSLSYFLDDKTTTAKDSVGYDTMLSLFTTSTDKYANSFELSTTKPGNRLFLFATDFVEDRLSWLRSLAKCFCPIWMMDQMDNYDFSFCGYVYLKEGLTQEWYKSWMMLCGRMLYFTSELIEPDQLQEIDLRKVLHIRLQDTSTNHLCLEAGPCLVIDAGRSVYIQLDLQRDTEKLYAGIQLVSSSESHKLDDQQLTTNNIPVIVEKCITHIELHGITAEGVYRLAGTHSKITKLLELFRKDARALIIRNDDYTVHEVANCLKRYFRSLDDPLLTYDLYNQWIDKAALEDQATKIQWYQYLLNELPTVNKATLKKVIHHLVNVSQHEDENKMGINQLASIFGPALMKLDSSLPVSGQTGFGYTNREISLMVDMLKFHAQLFEMDKSELEKKQKLEKAMEKLKALSSTRPVSTVDSGFIMPVYVDSPQGDCITLQVTSTMKVEELVELAKEKKKLPGEWVLHECVCDGTLERPLNDQARVFSITQEWQDWDEEYRKGVCLCLKVSDLIQTMHSLYEFHAPLFGELRFSEKKAYKKYCFEFKQSKLTCYKDARAANKIGEWEVEKLSIFHGVERRRNPPTEFGFTFIVRGERIKKSRDMPYFGRSVACTTREEAVNWLAGLYKAQYPNGFHS